MMKRLIVLILLAVSLGVLPSLAQEAQTPESAAAWREDLQALLEWIDRTHPDPYRGTTREEFDAFAADLDANILSMTDSEIVVGILRIVSSLVDGHSWLLPFLVEGRFTVYPLDLYQFSDGVYVVDAADEYAGAVGSKLLRIGETDVEQLVDRFARLVPGDNVYSGRVMLPTFMMMAELLQGVGFVEDVDHPALLLEYADGTQSVLDPARIPAEQFIIRFPQHYRLPPDESMLSLSHLTNVFWLTPLDEGRMIYAQYNETFSTGLSLYELRNALDTGAVERLILDLRYNLGGDIGYLRDLMNLLNADERFQQPGGLIVLIGRNTFSAAVVFLLWMQRDMTVFTIGEPTGGSPTMFENNRTITLPNSRLPILISSRARRDVPASDTRRHIDPDLLVELSSEDYFAGRDPVLDAALAYTP